MRFLKKLSVTISMITLAAMLMSIPTSAKVNVIQNGIRTNFRVITQFTEEKRQKINSCRVYDPNWMNYKNSIREYANSYIAQGYMVFDLKSLNKNVALSSVPFSGNRNLADDGIFCFDSFEHPTFDIIVSKMARSDYENYYLKGKRIESALDCTINYYDQQGIRVYKTISYDPLDEVVVILTHRYDGGTIS